MGRYPFLAYANKYLGRRRAYLSKAGYEELERKAKYLNKVFVALYEEGRISTANPAKMKREDVSEFI